MVVVDEAGERRQLGTVRGEGKVMLARIVFVKENVEGVDTVALCRR